MRASPSRLAPAGRGHECNYGEGSAKPTGAAERRCEGCSRAHGTTLATATHCRGLRGPQGFVDDSGSGNRAAGVTTCRFSAGSRAAASWGSSSAFAPPRLQQAVDPRSVVNGSLAGG